ncbi:helix-turn-helix domain-containing protein [Streptomyces sp. NPDC090994]|uniref:helix-turn-helix domain-containing protein n=1 Tax=Streptomyces sp. NPDC090994 TaxID=3365969 RepID=UPI003813FE7D
MSSTGGDTGTGKQDRLAAVGPRLRELRRRRGLTLARLAEETGVNASTLSRLEGGTRKPAREILLPLAEVAEVSPGGVQAHKLLIPPRPGTEPDLKTHEGFEWVCVLAGRLRLLLGDRRLVLRAGEAAEFDTHVPHRLGPDDDRTVELPVLSGPQGERAHLRARTT